MKLLGRTLILIFALLSIAAQETEPMPLPVKGKQAAEESKPAPSLWDFEEESKPAAIVTVPAGTIPEALDQIPPPPVGPPPEKPIPQDALIPEPTEVDREPIPWDHMFKYFATRPEEFLINPQYLLGETRALDTSSFLTYHAEDRDIDIYLLIFDGHQEVGSASNLQELATSWFPGEKTCVVSYYLGKPEKTKLALSRGVRNELPDGRLPGDLLADCIASSQVAANPEAQLEHFLIRLSIRLYRLEVAMEAAAETAIAGAGESANQHPANASSDDSVLAEVPALARAVLILGALALAASTGVGIGVFILHRERERERRYYFPEPESDPRLGAPHSGGNGSVLRFGSASDSARL